MQDANARIQEMVQASLAQANAQQQSNAAIKSTADQVAAVSRSYAQQTTASAAATESIAAEATAFNAAVAAKVRAMQLLNAAFAGNLATAEGVAAAEAALDGAMGAGAITASEQAAYIERLAAAQAVEAESAEVATVATNAHTASMVVNGGVARELGVILGELARGNTARLEGSLVTLGNRTGLLAALFNPLTLVIAGVVAEFGVLAVAAEQVAAENDKTNKSIEATGNYAGQTTGSIDKMAASITASNGRISQSRAVLDQLVASGRVSSQALQSVGQAAVDMAALTGESAEKATAAVLQIFDGTSTSLLKANDQYHFLTTSIYDQITALEQEGDTQAAMDVAARAFHDAAVQRIQDMNAQLSGLARWWDNVKTAADNAWQRMKTGASLITGTADDQTQLYALQGRKEAAQNHEYSTVGRIRNMFFGSGLVDQADSSFEQWTPEDETKLQALQKKVQDATDAADQKSLTNSLSTGAVDAAADLDRLGQSLDRNKAKQAELNKLNADFLKLWKGADPGDSRLAGVQAVTDEDGNVSFSGGMYDQYVADINKRYDTKTPKPKSDKAAEDAQAQLIKLLNDEQGALDPVAKAWATYNDKVAQANALADKAKTANGANVEAIDAERDAVIAAAASARDAQLDAPAKKAREAFEKLLQSLKDANGIKFDGLRAQLQTLKDDLDKGVISASEYQQAVQGVLNTQLKPLPTYKGVGSSVGGSFGELDKINNAGNDLDKQYAAELAALVDLNQKKLLADQDFVTKENALYTDYYAKKQALQDASNEVLVTGIASTLEQSANTVEKSVGKNTEAYRIAFAASKAAAIAQASINLGKAISNAGADVPFPANIAAMATVGAQMIALISQITSVQAGFSEGGYTGRGGKYQVAGVVHRGEGVLSQENIAAMGGPAAFEAFRAGLDGYADGGYVGGNWLPVPLAQPEPRLSADAASAAASRNAASGGNPDGGTHIHVWSIEEAAEKLAESPTMQKAVVHIVGDNPRTIQGKWGR
ncbi:phage tail length tape measure family protein [Dyella japonica]|uniref:Phage-related minor tail protein n=1 Tax=Dyella japonica TaxID=231455 RepID=A0ABV2JUG0_9GAMM